MQKVLILALLALVAGCVETPANTVLTDGASPAPPGPSTNETTTLAPPSVEIGFGAAGTTKAETVTLFVNTTGPVDLVAAIDGAESIKEQLAAPATRTLPLAFGRNEIRITLAAPGFKQETLHEIVRLGETKISIDYGVFHPAAGGMPRSESFDVWIDVDSRPSAAAYAEEGIANMDAFTAHDHLVVFEEATGKEVVFEYFPSFQGFGVSRIDGAGSAVSSDAPPWWCYSVNDASADGISIQPVAPGDVVAWELGSCA